MVKKKENNWLNEHRNLTIACVIVVLFVILMTVIPILYKNIPKSATDTQGNIDTLSNELQIQATKLQSQLPKKMNETSTMTEVTSSGHVINYHLTLTSDVDESQLSNQSLKDPMVGTLCLDKDTRAFLDTGATFKYTYTHSGSGGVYNTAITKYDCVD